MIYAIEKRIHTLNENAVMGEDNAPSFSELDITFMHWEFNYRDGWLHNYWLARCELDAPNYVEAFKEFSRRLGRVIPRVALIGQCYIESVLQPFLIWRKDRDLAWFRYTRDVKGVPLMFGKDELKALSLLLKNSEIPEEFYLYWNDAVNTIGYSPKLLIMFSALEALFKKDREKSKDAYYAKIEAVLGPELKVKLYGTKDSPNTGLRQRLVHGEYLGAEDAENSYVEAIHKKLIEYFNNSILREKLIRENVVHPQRHLFGNKEGYGGFLRPIKTAKLELKPILVDAEKNGLENLEEYEFVYDESLTANY